MGKKPEFIFLKIALLHSQNLHKQSLNYLIVKEIQIKNTFRYLLTSIIINIWEIARAGEKAVITQPWYTVG
jgi:hypothetical protein